MALMIAIDAGTTGVRALVLNAEARVIDVAYRELRQCGEGVTGLHPAGVSLDECVACTEARLATGPNCGPPHDQTTP